MKKIISISLAVIMIIAIIPFSAFAATPAEAYAKMTAARDKLYAGKEAFTAAESYDFLVYLKSGGNADNYKDAYVSSLKTAVKDDTLADAASYALAIKCLRLIGGADPTSFDKGDGVVNLYEIMETKGTTISSPYLYRYIFEAGASEEFVSNCLDVLNQDYTPGSGYDPWHYAFSCDTNASVGICYSASGKEQEKVADLASTLDAFKTENGYISDTTSGWGDSPNADSTACALAFLAYTGDTDKANEAYDLLGKFEVEGGNDGYGYTDNTAYNSFATKDALLGLIEYCRFLDPTPIHEHEYVLETTDPTCTEQGYTTHTCDCGESFADTYVAKVPHNYNEVSVVAPKANALGYTQYKCSRCGELKKDAKGKVIKDKFTAPTGKVSGVKCAARTAQAEKISWNKVKGATAYQIQIINSKGKVLQTKATKSNSYTFKKLSASTAYKFRVRFYITASGKNYFGKWSTIITSPTLPKGTSLVKVTPAKKALTAKWKKQAGVTGYQVYYKYFDPQSRGGAPHCKTITVKGAAKTSYTAKKLMANTKHYVKVRTYKTIGGKNYFSAWSAVKTVKTK